MDINRTIIATDSTQSYSPEDFVNLCLAKSTKALWDTSLKEPIDFYTYVYTSLLPGDRSDRALRKKRRDCVHSFVHLIQENDYPVSSNVLENYSHMVATVTELGENIFPSFFNLLNYLEKRQIKYTIIFRTFGNDLGKVLKSLEPLLNTSNVPLLQNRSGKLAIQEMTVPYTSLFELAKTHRFIGIQDDFQFWNSNNESSRCGKAFPLSKEVTSFFFDDNIEEDNEERNIVSPIIPSTNQEHPITPLIKSGHIVKVNTLEAICNDTYFIEKIEPFLTRQEKLDSL